MSFHLRLANATDIPALSELIPISVRALSAGHYTSAQIESATRHAFGVDSQLIADGTFLVAEERGQVIGCGGWSFRRKIYGGDQVSLENQQRLDPDKDAARIRAFFVHPQWARRGIGSALFLACARAAAAAGFKQLELLGTLPGEPLYRALGFEVAEYVDATLADGVAIRWVRMTRPIREGEFA